MKTIKLGLLCIGIVTTGNFIYNVINAACEGILEHWNDEIVPPAE